MAPTHRSMKSSSEDDRAWSKEEDDLLLRLVGEFGTERGRQSNWPVIASYFPKRTMKNCRKRYFYTLDTSITHGKWSKEEDDKLLDLIEIHGHRWKEISYEMKGRTDDQCSSRYLNCLQCKSTPWSAEEDATLLNLFEVEGPMWTKISASIPGRSALNCRNRYRKFGGIHTSKKGSNSRSRQRKASLNSDSQTESTDVSIGWGLGDKSAQDNISDINTFNSVIGRIFPQLAPEDAFSALLMMQLNTIQSSSSPHIPDLELRSPESAEYHHLDLPQRTTLHSLFDLQNIFSL